MENLFVAEPLVLNLLRFAQERGVTNKDVFESLGLDVVKLKAKESKSEMFSFQQFAAASQFIEQKIKDPELGLHLGELYSLAALGIVGQLIQFSRTIKEAIEKACSNFNLISNVLQLKLDIKRQSFFLIFEINQNALTHTATKHLLSSSMVFALKELKFLIDKSYTPLRVACSFPSQQWEEYKRVFGQKVQFNATANYLEFDNSMLEQPILFSDYELLLTLEKEACKRLTAMPEPSVSLKTKIESIIYALLDPALPSIEDVAANLNMSSRSLQRKLEEKNTSYSEITENIKKDLAVSYLEKNLSIKEVSYLMGYTEPSTFVSAFKKWFGITPFSYQKLQTNNS